MTRKANIFKREKRTSSENEELRIVKGMVNYSGQICAGPDRAMSLRKIRFKN